MTSVFINANPVLLGSDTHAASLTGSVSALDGVNVLSYTIGTGGVSGDTPNPNVEFIYFTHTFTPTKPINKIFVRFTTRIGTKDTGGTPRTVTFRLREDDINGAILSSQFFVPNTPTGTAVTDTSINIDNQSVGARNYVRTIELGSGINTYNIAVPFTGTVAPTTIVSYVVDIDDTNAAILTGSNTQTAPPTKRVFT